MCGDAVNDHGMSGSVSNAAFTYTYNNVEIDVIGVRIRDYFRPVIPLVREFALDKIVGARRKLDENMSVAGSALKILPFEPHSLVSACGYILSCAKQVVISHQERQTPT